MECYEQLASASEETCLKECRGMYSGILVETHNKTLALNGGIYDDSIQTFFREYLLYKRGYESEFDNIYESIKEPTQRKGWPFLNEQAVLIP